MKKYLFLLFGILTITISTSISVNAEDIPNEVVDTSNHIYTYSEMVEDLILLQQMYPDYILVSSIGITADQRPIYQVVLGSKDAPNAVYIQSTTHGREWLNTMMVMKQLEMNLINWQTCGNLYQNCAIYIVPMVNPDGVTISQYGVDGIISEELKANIMNMSGSSNPSRWKANACGVDLNRNYSIGWESLYKSNVQAPASQDYKGIAPFTESETIAVAQAMTQRHFNAAISYHSYEGVIYWKLGQTGELYEENERLANYISGITGYGFGEKSILHGLEYNWSVFELGIPTLLIETGTASCPLPYSQWETLWERNKDVMSSMALLYQ